jgi:hypothetical protein
MLLSRPHSPQQYSLSVHFVLLYIYILQLHITVRFFMSHYIIFGPFHFTYTPILFYYVEYIKIIHLLSQNSGHYLINSY